MTTAYFFIVDRRRHDHRGGYNVYPREIEEVLYEHPDVREAAVIGIPMTARRGGRRRDRPDRGRSNDDRRSRRLLQGTRRGVQVPASHLARCRAAQGADRQDPQARDRAPEPETTCGGDRCERRHRTHPQADDDQVRPWRPSPPGPFALAATPARPSHTRTL